MLPWGNIPCRFGWWVFNDQLMLIGLTLSAFPLPFTTPFPFSSSLRIVELGNIWRRFLGGLISPNSSRFLWPSRGITPAQLPLSLLPPSLPLSYPFPCSCSCYDSPHCDLWLMARDYANRNDLCPTVAAASVQNCEIMENWQLDWTQWDKRRHLSSLGALNENMCRP